MLILFRRTFLGSPNFLFGQSIIIHLLNFSYYIEKENKSEKMAYLSLIDLKAIILGDI
jgi:hypothetical protein